MNNEGEYFYLIIIMEQRIKAFHMSYMVWRPNLKSVESTEFQNRE